MKKKIHHALQKALDKNLSCYVLITCSPPTEEGQMQVEMTYEGDANLVSYLIQGAQSYIDQEEPTVEASLNSSSLSLIK